MAITIDHTQIGAPVQVSTAGVATVAITTNVAVASNGLIVLNVFGDPPATLLSSVSGGGLTWTVHKSGTSAVGDAIGIASAPASSGLASGTTITATLDAATTSKMVGGMSILGADLTGSRVDGTIPAENRNTGANWVSTSYTIAAGSIIVGCAGFDFQATETPDAGTTECWSVLELTGGNSLLQAYRIEAVGAAYTVSGVWSVGGSTTGDTIVVAFKAAGGAAAAPRKSMTVSREAHRRSTRW